MRYIGIDVGFKGGLALLDADFALVEPMPTVPTGVGSRRRYNVGMLTHLLKEWSKTPQNVLVVTEYFSTGPLMGRTAIAGLFYGAGIIHGITNSLGLPYVQVAAQSWKRACGIPPKSKKVASVCAASRLFPHVPLASTEDGKADALLIAWYAQNRKDGR